MAVELNSLGHSIGGWRATAAMAGGFSKQVIMGRWFMVFASLLIMAMAGATYMFGLYSGDIKSSLGYDQTTVNLLSFFKDFGGNIGILSGLINEVTPPWVVLSMGAAMNFSGYFMIWLAVTKRISKPRLWLMCMSICIGANSQSFANTGALVTCVKNFPASRGIVLGLLKGFVGLSGAIITQIYHAFYGNNTESLILLIAWLPAAVSFVFLGTIRLMRTVVGDGKNEIKIFYELLYISLGLAGFLMVIIIVQNRLVFSQFEYIASASIVLLLLLAPLAIILREEIKLWGQPQNEVPIELRSDDNDDNDDRVVFEKKPVSCWRNILNPPERGEDYTILQALFSIDMMLLFAVTTFGVGGTLTAIDNLGQIGRSLGYPKRSISTFVSLVSIWNYLGRVVSGFGSEILLSKFKFPRPLMLTFVLLLSISGHLLIAFGVRKSLYLSSVVMGFCFGAQWPLIFAIISEIFGLKYYSTLYNLGSGASPVGNYILNVRVAGGLYDAVARRQMAAKGLARIGGEDLTCDGVECYKAAFMIITAVTLVSCGFSLILAMRTRKFYKGDIYKNFRVQQTREINL